MPKSKTRLRAKSAKAAEKRNEAARLYEDGQGVTFLEAVAKWEATSRALPELHRVDRPEIREQYRGPGECWLCGRWVQHRDPAHIVGGFSRGRCDSHANLMSLCRPCHDETQSDRDQQPRVWLAKWTHDREHTDWIRLFRLAGGAVVTSLDTPPQERSA